MCIHRRLVCPTNSTQSVGKKDNVSNSSNSDSNSNSNNIKTSEEVGVILGKGGKLRFIWEWGEEEKTNIFDMTNLNRTLLINSG